MKTWMLAAMLLFCYNLRTSAQIKEGAPPSPGLDQGNTGLLEYWNEAMRKPALPEVGCIVPTFHHSNTPVQWAFRSSLIEEAAVADTLPLWLVETIDDNEYTGQILDQDAERLILKTEALGVISIPKANIRRIVNLQGIQVVSGQVWFENPQATRYFWAPNGYSLKPGEGYYQNVWVLFNQASIGLSRNFSVGVGMMPLFLFSGTPSPAWVTPKLSIPVKKDKVNLGAGALFATIIGEDAGFAGIAYGIATFGSRDKNFTAGLGYGFADGEWADAPILNLSAMIRTGRRGYFLTENYFASFDGEFTLVLFAGGRRVGKGFSLDYGLILPTTAGEFIAIPWLGIIVPFGSK